MTFSLEKEKQNVLQFRCLHLNVQLNTALIYIISTKWRFTRQKPNELVILKYICI